MKCPCGNDATLRQQVADPGLIPSNLAHCIRCNGLFHVRDGKPVWADKRTTEACETIAPGFTAFLDAIHELHKS